MFTYIFFTQTHCQVDLRLGALIDLHSSSVNVSDISWRCSQMGAYMYTILHILMII